MVIDAHREEYGVEPICRSLGVAPSTYYAVKAREREPSQCALSDARMLVEIRRVYGASRGGSMAPGRCGGSWNGGASGWRGARWNA